MHSLHASVAATFVYVTSYNKPIWVRKSCLISSNREWNGLLYYSVPSVPLVDLCTLHFTRMPGESYRRRLGSSLLYLCYVFRTLINCLMCWASCMFWLHSDDGCSDAGEGKDVLLHQLGPETHWHRPIHSCQHRSWAVHAHHLCLCSHQRWWDHVDYHRTKWYRSLALVK